MIAGLPCHLDFPSYCSYQVEDSAHSGPHFYKRSIHQDSGKSRRYAPDHLKLLSKLVKAA